MQLEDLQPKSILKGLIPDESVTVVSVEWFGSDVIDLVYKSDSGSISNELLNREDESRISIISEESTWSFDGNGSDFRLVSEAQRIRLAHLFDPLLAIHTSNVRPLPHQISAVYDEMIPRQPLRFLLADDPGAGKTIMAGLLIKELMARGDIERCLIVCPGSLAEQWQGELYHRFQLEFDVLTNEKLNYARTNNWFLEENLVIARLDKLSRDDSIPDKLKAPDAEWDLVVVDEAHKMSATFFGGEIKYTKRYRLGQLLSGLTRHLLLMTATPHNGKETDFQLFLALLDGDRFEGRFRDGVHKTDVSDLMRRMVKEKLVKFDGKPLFPERIANTVAYQLSEDEQNLYLSVTDYVKEEFSRVDELGNRQRAGTVGFALTLLQRRLASSPEAIYQSLCRRCKRLESVLSELLAVTRGHQVTSNSAFTDLPSEVIEDLDDIPENEFQDVESEILDRATASQSINELEAEIKTLKTLESHALAVRDSGKDTKWNELATILDEIFVVQDISSNFENQKKTNSSSN
ncbi:MAG: SNF2-related protein, partial [Bacteroidetes bacterium]|nr:SNF2-related protein [Bacteroidota bacterium]